MTSNNSLYIELESGTYFKILRKLGHITRLLLSAITFATYKPFLRSIGVGSTIHPFASLRNHRNISIGRYVKINRNSIIWPSKLLIGDNVEINPGVAIYGDVSIADNVLIGPNTVIAGGSHGVLRASPMRLQDSTSKGISIKSDVWIGANVVILDGVTIEQGTIIGAGSVVTRSTDQFMIYAGVPTRVVSERS